MPGSMRRSLSWRRKRSRPWTPDWPGAEAVLAEQREHAISPSLGLWSEDGQEEWTFTLAVFSEGLADLLGSLHASRTLDSHRRVGGASPPLLAGAGVRGRVTVPRGRVELLPGGRSPLDPYPRGAAPGTGWEWHIKPYLTNWINVQATTQPDIGSVADQAVAMLRELFGLDDQGLVSVKMISSTRRGDTPAGPIYKQRRTSPSTLTKGRERTVEPRHWSDT